MCRRFETLCSIFVDGVNKKNNREEIARLFIQVKVWVKRSLGQTQGGGTRRGRVRVEEDAVEGDGPPSRVESLKSRRPVYCLTYYS